MSNSTFHPTYEFVNFKVDQTATLQNVIIQGTLSLSSLTGFSGSFIGATGPAGPSVTGPTGSAGAPGPTGPSGLATFTIGNFSTGAVLLANTASSIVASSSLKMSTGGRDLSMDGQFTIYNSTYTGTSAHQFVYNSYGFRTYEFLVPTGGANAVQSLSLDPHVTELTIECWGAGGGGGFGGNGGYSKTTLSGLTGSNVCKIWVGAPEEGGPTVGPPPYMPTVVLASGSSRYVDLGYSTGYASGIQYFVTGPTGSQTYNIATVCGTSQLTYFTELPTPDISGDQVTEWNNQYPAAGSLTGTIFLTGPYPYGGYTSQFILNYNGNFFFGATGIDYYVVPATGINAFSYSPASGAYFGGGASFVYLSTGSQYMLTCVAGGGGANGQAYAGQLYVNSYNKGLGGASSSNASTTSVVQSLIPYNLAIQGVIPDVCGGGATGSLVGSAGTSNTGTSFYNPNGGSVMPSLVSNVSGNLAATGGAGWMSNLGAFLDYYAPIDIQTNPNILSIATLGGGGGGRGYAGGGGGGIYASPGVWSQQQLFSNPTGDAGGGGGGSSFCMNGVSYTDGFEQGNYVSNTVQSNKPGYVRITTYGYINPAFTVSSSGTTPSLNITQTPGFSMLEDGTSFFSKGVAIGKTNPEFLLDVEGDISTIGNIQISNFQNIFKNPNFDPVLYSIINNNFNYSNSQQTVSLNYALASLSLNIGYLENAISGLGTMLGYAFGTYNENGEIVDLPFWLKQWMANYYPVSSSGLTNYVASRQTSSTPSRSYYLQTEELIPFGKWAYLYCSYLNPTALFSPFASIGVYVENNNYYVFQKTGTYDNLSSIANLYILNSVFATKNPYLLQQYNSFNTFNIAGTTYNTINNEFQLGVPNLVMYPHYTPGYDPATPAINYLYDPSSSDTFYFYNPQEEPHYWYNHAFYDFGVYYTGSYTEGYFINNVRPIVGSTGFAMSHTMNRLGEAKETNWKEESKKMKQFSPWKAVASTKVGTVATVQPLPATQTLATTTATNSTQTIASLARSAASGPVQTTVSSNVPLNGTLKGTSQIVSLGIV